MKVYKGTDKNIKCRGYQFTPGVEAVEDEAKLCSKGFHACESPLDVLGYYPPGLGSRYFEAELEDVSPERESIDTKVCGKRITLGAEIGIPGLVKAHIERIKAQVNPIEEGQHATGTRGAASATGDQGAASATGDQGAASATGDQGAASATGDKGAASATGYQGAASATGYQGAASATGDKGAASATGYQGAASVNDCGGIAVASGFDGRVRAGLGSAICLCERGDWNGKTHPLLAVKAAIVDGETIKADTWYTLKNGEFVEVADDE